MISLLTVLVVFFVMEGITWFTHKYIMHGVAWFFHKDHHQPGYPHIFQKNDFFFVIFAIPSILCFYVGMINNYNFIFFIGVGILCYGFAYFLVHDIFIHRRFKWFNKLEHPYFKALRKAHKIHHKHLNKEDGECFGMLYVPYKYFKEYFNKQYK